MAENKSQPSGGSKLLTRRSDNLLIEKVDGGFITIVGMDGAFSPKAIHTDVEGLLKYILAHYTQAETGCTD